MPKLDKQVKSSKQGQASKNLNCVFLGEVSSQDMATITKNTYFDASVYDSNPQPYPDLLTNTRYPYNAEGKLSELTESFVTPIGKHFVRNHCAVPDIDPQDYTLTITGEGVQVIIIRSRLALSSTLHSGRNC